MWYVYEGRITCQFQETAMTLKIRGVRYAKSPHPEQVCLSSAYAHLILARGFESPLRLLADRELENGMR